MNNSTMLSKHSLKADRVGGVFLFVCFFLRIYNVSRKENVYDFSLLAARVDGTSYPTCKQARDGLEVTVPNGFIPNNILINSRKTGSFPIKSAFLSL